MSPIYLQKSVLEEVYNHHYNHCFTVTSRTVDLDNVLAKWYFTTYSGVEDERVSVI